MCQASPILGYDNYSKCITECPKEINKLWFCLSTTYKLLFPKKFTNKQYIDTYWSLKKYALTLQKMALKKKTTVLEILIDSYDKRKYAFCLKNFDIMDVLLQSKNLNKISTLCVGLGVLYFIILDMLSPINFNQYRLISMISGDPKQDDHVAIQQLDPSKNIFITKDWETKYSYNNTNSNINNYENEVKDKIDGLLDSEESISLLYISEIFSQYFYREDKSSRKKFLNEFKNNYQLVNWIQYLFRKTNITKFTIITKELNYILMQYIYLENINLENKLKKLIEQLNIIAKNEEDLYKQWTQEELEDFLVEQDMIRN